MIAYSYRRAPGGARYTSANRAAARKAANAGSAATLTAAAKAAMVDEDGIYVVADVLFEVESNRVRRPTTVELLVGGAVVAPAGGTVASALVDGKRAQGSTPVLFPAAGSPDNVGAGVRAARLTWADARPINVVDVVGVGGTGELTQIRVSTIAAGGAVTVRGTFNGAGRFAAQIAPYDAPITCYGVLVEVLAAVGYSSTSGTSTLRMPLVEIDPSLVWDVSGEVDSLEVRTSGEEDPSASTDPYGTYAAGSLSLTLDDTSGAWSNPGNTSLDSGHRIEVALGVQFLDGGVWVEELLPMGVFYAQPFDTDSDSATVTINAVDRLGRDAGTTVNEPVLVNNTLLQVVTRLARVYLDLDADQVLVDPSIAGTVIPYSYPAGDLGTYLADLAKAFGVLLQIDAYERLTMLLRTSVGSDAVADLTEDTALQRFTRPPGLDVTTSQVAVTASPMTLGADAELWSMPSGGIQIPFGESYLIVAPYSDTPATGAYFTGLVVDGSYSIVAATYFADRAEVKLQNTGAGVRTVADMRIRGNPLVETPIIAKLADAASVNRYGPRELTIDARLVQTQAQLNALALQLLEAFRSLNDAGQRRSPDLTITALGLMHLTVGDRVTLGYDAKGLGGDYVLTSRTLLFSGGSLTISDARARQAPGFDVLTFDSGELYDDGHVWGP